MTLMTRHGAAENGRTWRLSEHRTAQCAPEVCTLTASSVGIGACLDVGGLALPGARVTGLRRPGSVGIQPSCRKTHFSPVATLHTSTLLKNQAGPRPRSLWPTVMASTAPTLRSLQRFWLGWKVLYAVRAYLDRHHMWPCHRRHLRRVKAHSNPYLEREGQHNGGAPTWTRGRAPDGVVVHVAPLKVVL